MIRTYRDAAYAALRDLDQYAEAAGEEAQVGPLAIRARLRSDLEALDRAAAAQHARVPAPGGNPGSHSRMANPVEGQGRGS